MKKRIISCLLAVALCSSMVLSGCGSKDNTPAADSAGKSEGSAGAGDSAGTADSSEGADTATADIPQPEDKTYDITYTSTWWCDSTYEHGGYIESMIEDALNINLEVKPLDTTTTQDLMLASGEMPDCMWTSSKTPAWMYDNELPRTIPKAMVEYYCPKLIEYYDEFPLIYEMITDPNDPDSFLALTGITFQFVDYYLPNDYYRYDWIEKLGIDLGVNVEEVYDRIYVADDGIELTKFLEIMDAFVNQDPDGNGKKDTVGAALPNIFQTTMYSAYGFRNGVNEGKDGGAEMYYALDEYRDYLVGMADMYKKGLLDPNAMEDNRSIAWNEVNTNIAGYWVTSTNSLNSWAADRPPLTLLEANPDAKILLTPGVKPDGGEPTALTNATPAYSNFFVRADVDDQKLAKILQFVDYTLFGAGDKTTHLSMLYGEYGVDWEWDESGDMPIKLNTLASGERGTWTFGQTGQDRDVSKWTGEEPMFAAGLKYWGKDGSWMKWQTIPYKEDIANETNHAEISSDIGEDVLAYVKNFAAQSVLGQIDPVAEWDNYLAELDRMGYNDLMAELDKLDSLEEIQASYAK